MRKKEDYSDIKEHIIYGFEANGKDIEKTSKFILEMIIKQYAYYCEVFKTNFVRGELDTFKLASCLLVAINNAPLKCLQKRKLQ